MLIDTFGSNLSVSSSCKDFLSLGYIENSYASLKTLFRYCLLCEASLSFRRISLSLLCITSHTLYILFLMVFLYVIRIFFIFVQFLANKGTQKVIELQTQLHKR